MSCKPTLLKTIISKEIPIGEATFLGLDVILTGSADTVTNSFVDPNGGRSTLMDTDRGTKGILHQKFQMQWIVGEPNEIEFKGLSGTLEGQQGRPGVVYDNKKKEIRLLMSRPDGSFSIVTDKTLYMVVAAPTPDNLPDPERIFFVQFTNGVKLPQGWWHSVPFPPIDGDLIELDEYIAETNENNVINVVEEAGAPMRIQL